MPWSRAERSLHGSWDAEHRGKVSARDTASKGVAPTDTPPATGPAQTAHSAMNISGLTHFYMHCPMIQSPLQEPLNAGNLTIKINWPNYCYSLLEFVFCLSKTVTLMYVSTFTTGSSCTAQQPIKHGCCMSKRLMCRQVDRQSGHQN